MKLTEGKPRFRWARLSIRGLLAMVLACGGGLGWFVNGARTQREAVSVVERCGGSVCYDYQFTKGGLFDITAEPPWPGWLVRAVGIDALCTVVEVRSTGAGGSLTDHEMSDAELAVVARLRHLQRLTLLSMGLTDAGLVHLASLKRLEHLTLVAPGASGAGLACLDGMGRLEDLWIEGLNPIGDDDLAHVGRRAGLRSLHIQASRGSMHIQGSTWSQITDHGLARLSGVRDLRTLELVGADVTTDGLAALSGMSQLDRLFLKGCPRLTGLGPLRHLAQLRMINLDGSLAFNDAGLAAASGFPRLEWLNLEDTAVGDASLSHLRGLARLKMLGLDGTKITDLGLVHLTSLPALDTISLTRTSVGDAGAAHLAACPSLGQLDLRDLPGLTDVGFARLMGLKKLYRIDVTGTHVTPAAATAARLARPGPMIFH